MLKANIMTETGYITAVKRALVKEGFWGPPVSNFVEELRDHFRTKTKALEAEGHLLSEASKLAAVALGEPKAVATEWSQTFQSTNWTARHPWLAGGIGICGLWVILVLSLVAFVQLIKLYDHSPANRPSVVVVESWLFLVNWVPWIMGMGVLLLKTALSPMGWRQLLVLSFALGLATSAWQFDCYFPPDPGLKGCMTIGISTWSSLWSYPIFYCLNVLHEMGAYQDGAWARVWLCPSLFKLLFPPLACLATRQLTIRSANVFKII